MVPPASRPQRQWPFHTGADDPASPREFARGRAFLRWVPLLYTFYFFVMPYHRHSARVWAFFAVFYAAFLALYFLVLELNGRSRYIAFSLFFLIGFVYYPYNASACGTLVFAFVMLAFFVERLRTLFLVLVAMMTLFSLETWLLGFSLENCESVLFFSVVVGLSNFAYSQQVLANSRLTAANVEIERLSQEAERERIARDLHDLLGHTLTVITVKLDLARRLLPRDPDHARNEIVEAEQTARNALAEVREAVVGYRADGLAAEIARARRSLRPASVQLTTAVAPVELSAAESNVLCLALREAVTNIVRHARATTCHIEFDTRDGVIHLNIDDDGCGIEPTGGNIERIEGNIVAREGNGLRGMRERLHSMGGSLHVVARAAGGTSLRLTLPLATTVIQRTPGVRETAAV